MGAKETGRVSKNEAQAWLALHNIILNQEVLRIYEITDQRKNTLLRLLKYLNDVLIDQIPPLANLKLFLDRLTIFNTQ